MPTLDDLIPDGPADADALYDAFAEWAAEQGTSLYPHQDEAIIELYAGANVILSTPTGSGKSLVATAAHFLALSGVDGPGLCSGGGVDGPTGDRAPRVSFYTAPIKALVSEKFFALCRLFGADNVGMITGDASVNADAPIICCTAEILANISLREGDRADVGLVIMDEFHFYAEPDRGWAWQVPLLLLPQAQFLVMSATLGDLSAVAEDLHKRTDREVAVVSDAERPVPLSFSWAMTPITETIDELLTTHQAPVYIVHFTQKDAVERAQSLTSMKVVTREDKDAIAARIGAFRFTAGFGKTLSALVRQGIGVHHAGMLPRYRRLVEQLAQDGLLKVICGTDTLGVGINVPIRTVLFTGLTKFDGTRQRVLRIREFHQIAGRAGRAGFDTSGYVVVQAPEHLIANERALAKFGDDAKKRRSYTRKKPPEGFVGWTQETFDKLVNGEPEALAPRMRIDHSMILNLVARPGDPFAHLRSLVSDNHDHRSAQLRLTRHAIALSRSLLDSGVLQRLPQPHADGRSVVLSPDVADNFALNQPLAPFALAALAVLEPSDAGNSVYHLDVVSAIESVLDDPRQVLFAQRSKAKGEAVAQMKADGIEYDQRMELLDEVSWPMPLAELLEATLAIYRQTHPWVREDALSPKAVVRDMYERAMSFTEFVGYYGLTRSEGVLLRYLSDAYRTLRQTVPATARNDELDDLIDWLGETIRQTDSSLLEEWEALTDPEAVAAAAARVAAGDTAKIARPITGNERAFRVMVRNAMWRRVELAARDQWRVLAELEQSVAALTEPPRDVVMGEQDWDAALDAYFAEHDTIETDSDARGPALLHIEQVGRQWQVRQTLADPAGDRDWLIEATCDLDASDQVGEPVLVATAMRRMG
ncbi:DEAD/DEAH box helicase [soil metagenome]